MHPSAFQNANWYHAVTLTERLAALRGIPGAKPHLNGSTDLARRRLQRWQAQTPFPTDTYFAQRLTLDGLSEQDLLGLLGEPIADVRQRFAAPPDWLTNLAMAFARPTASEPIPCPESLRAQETAGFLNTIEPLLRLGRDRVREGARALSRTADDIPFDPDTVLEILYAPLPACLLSALASTMALEINVARLQGVLAGTTPAERFRSFVERLRQREHTLALLQEYPVLARYLLVQIEQWAATSLEFLQHLSADRQALRTTFSPEKALGHLSQIEAGAGDSHRGGRAVLIARFTSGLKVVYKPKALAVDVHFQELLTWLNERGNHPPFRTLKILDRGPYGWVEFVSAGSCASVDEVRRFYRRQGGYLALLYALEATDFHFENLIAAGEHPVLIDLEALFHPRPRHREPIQAAWYAGEVMAASVLHVGLLPQRIWSDEESDGIDLSGLGAVGGQLSPRPAPYWDGIGTDGMQRAFKRMPLPDGRHRPAVQDQEVRMEDYAADIETGFGLIYRLLQEHRDELLAQGGPLARFAGDEVRVILRATHSYGLLLRESVHPDLLRDALDRDRFFDWLWAEVKTRPEMVKVVAAERQALLRGDIPMFTTRTDSRDIWSDANERIAEFSEEAGMELVRRRLRQLSDADLARQLWFIRASLATVAKDTRRQPNLSPPPAPRLKADRDRLLAAACAVGDRLEALALRSDNGKEAAWIGLTYLNQRQWSLLPLGPDLYDGLPGIALFLGYLAGVTGEERYTRLAQAAMTTLRRQVEPSQGAVTAIGGFTGWGGLIYAYTHLAAVWEQPALLAEAEAMVERLPALIEQDEHLDVIGGAAGCIGSLLSLYRCAPSERTLSAANQCADRLLARCQAMEQGIGWLTPVETARPLTGFSHGAAGMAWALLELAAATGISRFQTAARAAIAYERGLFSEEAGNWPDLRSNMSPAAENGRARYATFWCHGAAGIGLARLQGLRHLDDEATRAEIAAALRTTVAEGFGDNHSLCHGDLGNLEFLHGAGETLGDPRWRAEAEHRTALILESIERQGWRCGTPTGVESPGLMTGLAGIGYGLLRRADAARVPSVLVLAGPTWPAASLRLPRGHAAQPQRSALVAGRVPGHFVC
jgi:type 2 lantibiotic biosynthesis protein LanM